MTGKLKIRFYLLLLLSGFIINTHAQKPMLPDSLGKSIMLPGKISWESIPGLYIGYKSSYVHIIRDTTRYYSVFKRYSKDSLPVIDFNVNELLLYVYCEQCLTVCPNNVPCHRNACNYTEAWYIRRKKF